MTHRNVRLEIAGQALECQTELSESELQEAVALVEQSLLAMESRAKVLYGDAKKEADHGVRFILGTLNLAYQLIRQEKEALKHRTDLEQKLLTLLEDVPGDTPFFTPLTAKTGVILNALSLQGTCVWPSACSITMIGQSAPTLVRSARRHASKWVLTAPYNLGNSASLHDYAGNFKSYKT